jgi:anti-sigma factor (TIGR02949 family)
MYEYIDRELTDQDREEMALHLHTCQSCFSRVEFEKLLKEKVREAKVDEAGAHLASRIRNLIKDF